MKSTGKKSSPIQRRNGGKSGVGRPAVNPRLWHLDPAISYLNHGAFGACPKAVLRRQTEFRERLEREPIQFLFREFEALLDETRLFLARFLGGKADQIVFVANATAGVNTVLRSLKFRPGDELLVSDQEYNASRNALVFSAESAGARVKVVPMPFPVAGKQELIDSVLGAVTSRTRLVLLDHVGSQTSLVYPLEEILAGLNERGIESLIDGAHAPGMIDLKLEKLGATYYTGNCHKWLCAPKASAFLHVREDCVAKIHPLSISHGRNSPRTDRSRFQLEFGWTGTWDPSAVFCVVEAIEYLESLVPGGWPAIRKRNHDLAVAARNRICGVLKIAPPAPDSLLGSMVSIPLPAALGKIKPKPPLYIDPLQDRLFEKWKIDVPIVYWPSFPKRLLRISAQLYNSAQDIERLAEALRTELS
jgi:isopenicillin-N epimerase